VWIFLFRNSRKKHIEIFYNSDMDIIDGVNATCDLSYVDVYLLHKIKINIGIT